MSQNNAQYTEPQIRPLVANPQDPTTPQAPKKVIMGHGDFVTKSTPTRNPRKTCEIRAQCSPTWRIYQDCGVEFDLDDGSRVVQTPRRILDFQPEEQLPNRKRLHDEVASPESAKPSSTSASPNLASLNLSPSGHHLKMKRPKLAPYLMESSVAEQTSTADDDPFCDSFILPTPNRTIGVGPSLPRADISDQTLEGYSTLELGSQGTSLAAGVRTYPTSHTWGIEAHSVPTRGNE